MTDFEDTEEVVAGPTSLEVGETESPIKNSRSGEPSPSAPVGMCLALSTTSCIAASNPTLLSAHRSQSSPTSTLSHKLI
jgi:hypothetical protein